MSGSESGARAFSLGDESAMLALGAELAGEFSGGGTVWLQGDLGAGKTTLVRGLLRGLGFDGRVKSPSYGLLESYELTGLSVHHLDLYRLGHPEEIAYLGLEDLTGDPRLLLVEWPEQGRGWLPEPDWAIRIDHDGTGRVVHLEARTG